MPTLGLRLPLRVCILEGTVCGGANGRRTGYVCWSDDDQRRFSTGRFLKAEAIEQVRAFALAWMGALGSGGVLHTGPAPEPGAAAAEPSPLECRGADLPVRRRGVGCPDKVMRAMRVQGSVAQRLEPTAHNGLVAGSSPAGPTIAPSPTSSKKR